METTVRPLIGLIPKKIFEEKKENERFESVYKAIKRYLEAGLEINIEWVKEYNQFLKKYKNVTTQLRND